jgi:hypothetical protein
VESVKQVLISGASLPEAEMPQEEIRPTIEYIMIGRDYATRVARANASGLTFLPPYEHRLRPMNALDRFLSGGWRKSSWEAYISKENAKGGRPHRHPIGPRESFKRRVTLACLGALLADIALSFIIWLALMMGISVFGLESKWGLQIDAAKLLIGTFGILFVVLFLAFLVLIRAKKSKS